MQTCVIFSDHLFDEYSINNFLKLNNQSDLDCFYLLNKKVDYQDKIPKEQIITYDLDDLRKQSILFNENKNNVIWEAPHLACYYFFKMNNRQYDFYWHIEYDIIFDGNWKLFFEFFSDKKEDFLSCLFDYPYDWYLKGGFKVSFEVPESMKQRCWFPLSRFSNRLLCKVDEYNSLGKFGSSELLIPQMCNLENLSKRDINNFGRLFVESSKPENPTTSDFYYYSSFNWVNKKLKDIELKDKNILYHPVKSF